LAIVFSYARLNDTAILGESWTVTTLVGFGTAVVAAFIAWRTPKVHTVALETANELKKVTWPTLRETRAATIAVVTATAVVSVILFGFDSLWAKLSEMVY